MNELFETWLLMQTKEFGEGLKDRFEFHETDGYIDQTINLIWVGFYAGYELKD